MTYNRIISFRSGSKESADEKYMQALKWLVEQEVSFRMTCDKGARTLVAYFDNQDDIKRFKREFDRREIWLE